MDSKLKRIKSAFSLFKELYRNYTSKIVVLILLGFLNGVFGGIGVAMLIPLFSLVIKGSEASTDSVSRFIFSTFSYFQIEPRLRTLLILIALLFIFKAVILWIFAYTRIKILNDYLYDTRCNLYQKTLQANWSYLLMHKIGYLENILMDDAAVVEKLLKNLTSNILELTRSAIYLFIAFNISPLISFFTLGLSGTFLLFTKPLVYRTRKYAQKLELLRKEIAHRINESIIGVKSIKAAAIEKAIAEKGTEFFWTLRKLAIKLFFSSNIVSHSVEPLSVIFIILIFVISYRLQPNFNIVAFGVIIYLIRNVFGCMDSLQNNFHIVSQALPHARRIVSFQHDLERCQEQERGQGDFKFLNDLEFRNINFSYNKDKLALENISFKIKKGEMIGIVGSTGSGKTTIADLLLRLFEPQNGEILLDGKVIAHTRLGEWRNRIGYVSQDIFLENDTIENNIKFYNKNITETDMVKAARKANIYDFIQSLPQRFQTNVGERGVLLSGGERQRVVLARAFIREPEILILDEATSSLDNQSEALIQGAIEKLRGKLTIIIISHRLSFVANVDRLITLENGKIIEEKYRII